MAKHPLQSTLDNIETHTHQVTQQLLAPECDDLLQTSQALQAAILAFSQLVQRTPQVVLKEPVVQARMRKISAALASCRETLLRRTFITQSALSTLIPAARENTYAPAAGKFARQAYGSAGRQSGEFRMVSA